MQRWSQNRTEQSQSDWLIAIKKNGLLGSTHAQGINDVCTSKQVFIGIAGAHYISNTHPESGNCYFVFCSVIHQNDMSSFQGQPGPGPLDHV